MVAEPSDPTKAPPPQQLPPEPPRPPRSNGELLRASRGVEFLGHGGPHQFTP
jgi:hypothetical protein